MSDYAQQLAAELNLSAKNVQGAIDLIDQGNTIPFIARYRKEATGSMDDQVLRDLGDRLEYLRGLDKRKDEVTSSITEQGAMTPELTAALSKAKTLAEVEDIYRPYKPKRKTRASIAKARGLQPLATAIFRQDAAFDPREGRRGLPQRRGPPMPPRRWPGAQDIIAEAVSDDAACRAELRRYYRAFGRVASAKAKDEDSVYAQYYDYAEPLNKIPGHRVLALDRGEREGFLKVTIQVDAERAAGIVSWMFARKKTGGKSAELVDAAARDAYSRLIHPSLENELRGELSDAAAEGAIKVFGDNLRQLLLQPPIRGKTVMGLDPGYRMGCKVAVVDPTGKVLDTNVVYPVPEFKRVDQAKKTIKAMVLKNGVEVMAIGNNFEHAMMKAVSSTELGLDTMTLPDFEKLTTEEVIEHLHVQDSERAFCVYEALKRGVAHDVIYDITKIDWWFLDKLQHLADIEMGLKKRRADDGKST